MTEETRTAMAPVYLGIDVGGSGTRAIALRDDAVESFLLPGGSLALDPHALTRTLRDFVAPLRPRGVWVGASGARTAPAAAQALAEALAPECVHVVVSSDAELALLAAFGDGDGIVLCAGTGTVAVVRTGGKIELVGGYGYLLGDEGSAYDLGRRLLAAALRERDTAVESVSFGLGAEIERHTELRLDDVVREVYAAPADRARLTRLAELATASSHPAARDIVAATASSLVELTARAVSRFGPLPVRVTGGMAGIPEVRAALAAAFDATVVDREHAYAAALRARELDG